MTTQIALSGKDGGGNPITIRADQNPDNSVALHVVPEVLGSAVAPANPLPVALSPVPSVVSQAIEASRVLKSAPGTLFAFEAYFSTSGFIMLFDAASVPPDGAVVPRKVWSVQASQSSTFDKSFNPPLAMANGAVLVFSITGPFTKTQSDVAQFSAEIL